LIDARLLIVEPLIDFVSREGDPGTLCAIALEEPQRRARQPRKDERF